MAKKSTKKIAKKEKMDKCCSKSFCGKGNESGGCLYGMGFVGALIYYLSVSTGFWNGIWGVIKALLWPAFLVFELLKFLGA